MEEKKSSTLAPAGEMKRNSAEAHATSIVKLLKDSILTKNVSNELIKIYTIISTKGLKVLDDVQYHQLLSDNSALGIAFKSQQKKEIYEENKRRQEILLNENTPSFK